MGLIAWKIGKKASTVGLHHLEDRALEPEMWGKKPKVWGKEAGDCSFSGGRSSRGAPKSGLPYPADQAVRAIRRPRSSKSGAQKTFLNDYRRKA
jgi:hypothetical protein